MNMKSMYYCLFAGLLLGSCSDNVYEVTDNGVVVKVQNPGNDNAKLIRLQVMGDKLIHVSATPEKRFSDDKSLIVIPQKEKTSFDVTNNGDTVSISTNDINAYVLASTGELWFTDKNGKVILQENKGGGKTFTPIEIEGTKGYSIRQVFESPENEAFYGLGQHQSEEFNYFQYLSSYQIKTMVFCWTAIHSAVSEILMTIHNWMKYSNYTTKKVLKVQLQAHTFPKRMHHQKL